MGFAGAGKGILCGSAMVRSNYLMGYRFAGGQRPSDSLSPHYGIPFLAWQDVCNSFDKNGRLLGHGIEGSRL
jgi:hypothetical protein